MRLRTLFWCGLGLLLVAGVLMIWDWRGGGVKPGKIVHRPTSETVRSGSSAPKIISLQSISQKSLSANAPLANTNKFAYRLSNTSRTLDELMGDGRAVLLANALIDTRAPLNLGIPKSLQARGDPGAYIVQAKGMLDDAFRGLLKSEGAAVVSYIPNNAYLVRVSANGANALAGNPLVSAVMAYEPYYKVQSSLLAYAQSSLPEGAELNLGLFGDDAAATIQEIQSLGGQIFAQDTSPFGKIVRVIAPQDWTALARLPGVQIVEPFHARELANDLARVTLGVSTDPTNTANYTNIMELTGSNVVVDINDSGVDDTHPDFTTGGNRVFGDAAQSLEDTLGHGTHVAGIIAGNGAKSTTVTNAQGSSNPGVLGQYRGKAPLARLYSVGGIEGTDTNFISDSYMQQQAALTNALISNNSWGEVGSDGTYDLTAASYDAATRDALPGTTGSQPVLFVFAAGNDGNGDNNGGGGEPDTISSPGTAKDVITVGATEQVRNITNVVTALDGSSSAIWQPMSDTSYQIAGYSSRGNVDIGIEGGAGRFKPDVVAPGSFVISTRSQQWDTNAYFNPTNVTEQSWVDQVVDASAPNYYSVDLSTMPNVVGITIQVVPNLDSPANLSLPIYLSPTPSPANYPDPATPGTYVTPVAINAVTLSPAYLTTAIANGGFNYAVGDNGATPVNYDLVVTLTTTNDLGDELEVLHGLDDGLGTGPPYYYRYETGTSMAAPSVSGVLALMQDFFTNQWKMRPSPALLKAMLINGARTTSFYNLQVQNSINFEGWGLANLPDSLPVGITTNLNTPCSMFVQDQNPALALATGESQTFMVVSTNTQPLRITLAWTDPPGNPAAAIKLVNDLNLEVTNPASATVYYGNDIASGDFNTPESPGSPPKWDDINNVENVYLQSGAGTNYITVIGNRVNVNAVTAHTNNVVQDYALVISSGEGTAPGTLTVMANPMISNPTGDQQVTGVSSSSGELVNQFVGANTPLLGTNVLEFNNNTVQGFSGNWQVTIGMTNQWHFYVMTNTSGFTNAAFITFVPATLSVPRLGVLADDEADATQPEADIDLYVTTDSSLTNLNPAAISNCVSRAQVGQSAGAAFAGSSLSRGGTEFVADTNSQPNETYYVGVKSETQEAAEYDFLPVFSRTPFSQLANGNQIVTGIPIPAVIPGGNPAAPGFTNIVGLALYPMQTRRVIVTNIFNTEDFGDLVGSLTHSDPTHLSTHVTLNNHGSVNAPGAYTFIYDDSGAGDIQNAQLSDGPGSLNQFIGGQGSGPWILHEADSAEGFSNSVQSFIAAIQPHLSGNGLTIVTNNVAGGAWFYDYVDVPPGATNLTIAVTNLTGTANPPLELFVQYGDLPTLTNYDAKVTIPNGAPPPAGNSITISPPTSGTYYFGIYNPSALQQLVSITVTVGLGAAPATVNFTSSGPVPILDDAVSTAVIPVNASQTISSVNVGIAVQHPRISDLVFHLVSPDGTRILLMENRGGTSTNGAGGTATITTNVVATGSITLVTNSLAGTAADYFQGQTVAGWTVGTNQVSLANDPMNAYPRNNNLLALASGSLSATLATVTGQTYSVAIPYRGPGIAGWWRAENNANDSINGNNATTVQSITYVNGEVGQAFHYDGSNSLMAVPSNTNLPIANLTLECWVYPTDNTPGPIFDLGSPGQLSPVQLWVNWDGVRPDPSGIYGAGGWQVATGITGGLVTNRWNHLAFTTTSTPASATLWRDGVQVGSNTELFSTTPQTYANVDIGYRDPASGEPYGKGFKFSGNLDEASIYNRVLTASEIKAIYAKGTAGKFDPALFPTSPSLSLAEAQVSLNGQSQGILYGKNTNWQVYTNTFVAVTNQTTFTLTGLEPGVLLGPLVISSPVLVTNVVTNYDYLTFTENTNLTTTPIKFAVPPFVPAVWENGFEEYTPHPAPSVNLFTAGGPYNYFSGGWLVDKGSIEVLGSATGQTDEGKWFVDLDGAEPGEISTNIPTVPGQTYTFQYDYSRNPDSITAGFVPEASILINGSQLATIVANQVNSWSALDWRTTSFTFTATSYSTSLMIDSLDSFISSTGVLLDAISLTGSDSYYLPEQPMTPLVGENAEGNWTLEIQDDRAGDNLNALLLSWQLQFLFTTGGTSTGSLMNGSPQTNFISGNSIVWYQVNVPTNAFGADNKLLFASAPLNVWFSTNSPPTITNSDDILLISNNTNGTRVFLPMGTTPLLIPGSTYYLGVQNPNSFTINYGIEVLFGVPRLTSTVTISNILTTNNGIELQWNAPGDEQFQVEWTTNLTPPMVWNTNTTGITYTNGVFTFADPNVTNEQRFYRLIQLP